MPWTAYLKQINPNTPKMICAAVMTSIPRVRMRGRSAGSFIWLRNGRIRAEITYLVPLTE